MNNAGFGSLNRLGWGTVKEYFLAGWRDAFNWPFLCWLSPAEPVRLMGADASESLLLCTRKGWISLKGRRASIVAIELPEEMVLRRSISLPDLPDSDLKRVVAQEVIKSSPFPGDNTIYGFQSERLEDGRQKVVCAIAARDQTLAYLERQAGRLGKHQPEVWAPGRSGLCLSGFGESRRFRRLLMRRRCIIASLFLAAGLGFCIWATPTMQSRLRLIQAVHAYEALQKKSAPQLRLRDEFQNAGARLDEAVSLLDMPVEPLALIEDLSKLLSDEEWVSELRIRGNVVQLTGEGANASRLLQTFGEQPEYKEVKAVGASVKNGSRESFSFEFKFVPEDKKEK